jgi:hypothetical protein
MIFTRGLFKHKMLRFDLPGKIDEPFYLDIKDRMAKDPRFHFDTEVDLWKLYRGLVILSLITGFAIVLLFVFIILNLRNPVWLFIPFVVAVIGTRPTIYFGMLLFHFLKYRRDEKRFHTSISQAIGRSDNFAEFTDRFYSGDYLETTVIKAYYLMLPFESVRDFAEDRGLAANLCIYKRAKGDNYIVLSNSLEIISFIDRQEGIVLVASDDHIMKVIKEQVDYPYVYGNKRLKYLID